MRKEVAQLWVAALRSGHYKQGKQRLKIGNSYCCLGVLACLYDTLHGNPPDTSLGLRVYFDTNVQKWAGLEGPMPKCTIDGPGRTELAVLNDQRDYSFAEIADIIEQQYEEL
jgi:hypothetical protein